MERPENHHPPKLRHHIPTSNSNIHHCLISHIFAMPFALPFAKRPPCQRSPFTRFSRFSRLFWIASATFSSALPRKWHSLQTWVEVRQQGGDIKQSSRKNIKCEYHGITNCNIISIYLSIYRSIYLSIHPSIYLFIYIENLVLHWQPISKISNAS